MSVRRATPELDALVGLFYERIDALGTFEERSESQLPDAPRRLLPHDHHMTVTVEAFHGCPVTVEVLQTHRTPTHYSRKIVLHRSSDGAVVLFGLVRLSLAALSPAVRAEIESQQTPLGHVLIQHNVMRTVRLLSLWEIAPADELRRYFALPSGQHCFGRTALIYCDGLPAVELLEIVPASRTITADL